MSLLDRLLNLDLGNPDTVDAIVWIFAILTAILITSLIFQSFDNARDIRALDDPYRRFELLSQERSSRATTYSTAIVLAGAIFGYYQFIYSQREKAPQKFEGAEAILYSPQSSPPARIRAMDKLNDWAVDKGADGKSQVARVIADGLRVWAQKTNLDIPCKNSRVFSSRRVRLGHCPRNQYPQDHPQNYGESDGLPGSIRAGSPGRRFLRHEQGPSQFAVRRFPWR